MYLFKDGETALFLLQYVLELWLILADTAYPTEQCPPHTVQTVDKKCIMQTLHYPN